MGRNIPRKTFLKYSVLANLGLYLQPFQMPNAEVAAPPLQHGNVLFYQREDPEYEQLRNGFNKRIQKYPAVIAVCNNIQGIVEALRYAKGKHLPVAVKSGGHCLEGFSCNDGGMVINLSRLNKVEWIDADTIKTGPACTLSKMNDFLLHQKKILPGGSCGSVGIGGLVLGGGYGILSRMFGLACDSLTEVTMVDGTGRIRNSKDDPDLLWACKGGGTGNFGVIAEMKFKVKPSPVSLQSSRYRAFKVDSDRASSILEKWFALTTMLPNSCFSTYILNGTTVYILLTNTAIDTPEVKTVMDGLTAMTDKTTNTGHQPIAQALKEFYGVQHPVNFKNASAGLYREYNDVKNFVGRALQIVNETEGMIYQVNTLGGNIRDPKLEATASFPHRDYPYFSELQAYWEEQDTEQGVNLINKFERIQQIFNENGMSRQYCNYPDLHFKNWDTLYYGSNYKKLQQIKTKYDPENVIRHEQSIRLV